MTTIKNQPLPLLNNLTPSQFLAEYWQKKPLLIRGAFPNFSSLLSPNELAGLACEDDVQARIIQQKNGRWSVKNSPFNDADFTKLPAKNWTLLVQGVNHYLPQAADLLAQFNFIPHARLDDLMISYAPTGSGIGAHVDSYDVFLLQGTGQRQWQISGTNRNNPANLSLIEDAPLKILQHFTPEHEWVLEAGDMLYLPPQIAHCGTSMSDDCMTYSIGFRAPKTQELQHEFLSFLQDNLGQDNINADGLYSDTNLKLQNHPAEICDDMITKVSEMLQKITWDNNHVADFLGQYLTEPKLDVLFEPNKKMSKAAFCKQLTAKTLHLDLKSQMLFTQNKFYLNGEKLTVPENLRADLYEYLRELADNRYLKARALQPQGLSPQNIPAKAGYSYVKPNIHAVLAEALHEHYVAGFLYLKA